MESEQGNKVPTTKATSSKEGVSQNETRANCIEIKRKEQPPTECNGRRGGGRPTSLPTSANCPAYVTRACNLKIYAVTTC
ncbi:hypothetical protein EVAR_85824_1 [Eumeta japonica]|uniref:Uncharacterized protein n=1 Tax=Eumeta variegata TaxID=151549 RepID=A0A4C1UQB4_EUMVA|nr:hypothetical protein EVAR_85824_1 [Eumeta japonica]